MDNLEKLILKDTSLEDVDPKVHKRSPVDHWSTVILLERAAYLKKMARFGDGSATETLRDYPQHSAMLSFRSRDGDAEMHQDCALMICVLAGSATLVTGGTMTRAHPVEPGLSRGDSIESGTRQELKTGDVVHIPAGMAHQFLVAGEKTVTCFVMRIREVP